MIIALCSLTMTLPKKTNIGIIWETKKKITSKHRSVQSLEINKKVLAAASQSTLFFGSLMQSLSWATVIWDERSVDKKQHWNFQMVSSCSTYFIMRSLLIPQKELRKKKLKTISNEEREKKKLLRISWPERLCFHYRYLRYLWIETFIFLEENH